MKHLLTFAVILSITACPYLALAQDEDIPEEAFEMSLAELMNIPVTTASKTAQKLSEAPATMIVITEQMIKDRGYHYLEEILHDLPGFDFNKSYGVNYSTIFMRGFRSDNSDRFLLLFDGINENDIWKQTTWISRQYPVSQIKQIEVLYGPASALYGTNAFSGIINVITKKGEEVGDINTTATFGSWGRKNIELSSGRTFGDDFGYNFTLKYFAQDDLHQWDEYDAIDGEEDFSQTYLDSIGYVKLSATDSVPKLSYLVDGTIQNEPLAQDLPGENFGAHVNLMAGNLKFTGLIWTKKELEAYFYNPYKRYGKWTEWYETNQGYMLSHDKEINDKISLSTKARIRIHQIIDSREGGQKYYTSPLTSASLDSAHSQTIKVNDPTSFQLKPRAVTMSDGSTEYVTNIIYHYRLKTRDMMIEEQLNYNILDNLNLILGGKLTYVNTQEDYEFGLLLEDVNSTPRHLKKTGAAYAQVMYSPIDLLSFVAGGRYENQKDERGDGYSVFVPRISSVVKVNENLVFRLQYSEAFQEADDWHKFATDFDLRPASSTELEPEKLSAIELGTTINIADKVLVSGSGYFTKVSNFIEEVENTIANPYRGYVNGLHFENASSGEMKIYGYEVSINAKISEQFSLNANISGAWNYGPAEKRELDANGDYQTLMEQEIDDNGVLVVDTLGNPVLIPVIDDNVLIGDMAPIKINLGILYKIPGKLSIYPKVNFVATKKTINWQQNPSSSTKLREIEGYTIVGLNINVLNLFGAAEGLDFNLKVDNLLDSEYYNPGSRSADGKKYSAHVLQPGLNVLAGFTYRF